MLGWAKATKRTAHRRTGQGTNYLIRGKNGGCGDQCQRALGIRGEYARSEYLCGAADLLPQTGSGLFLFQESLEFGHGLEVLGAACRAFEADERRKVDAPELDAKCFDHESVGQKFAITAAPDNFAEQVQIAEAGCEGEIEAVAEGREVEFEREAGRRAPQIWGEW